MDRRSAHMNYISLKLNHKVPVIFHNLKAYDLHHVLQEINQFYFEINVIPSAFEKYMKFVLGNTFRISSNKCPQGLFNFDALRCGAYIYMTFQNFLTISNCHYDI